MFIGVDFVLVNKVNIGFVYSMQKHFLNRKAFLQSDKANFGSNFHYFVLKSHLIEEFALMHLFNLLLLGLPHPAFSCLLFKPLNFV